MKTPKDESDRAFRGGCWYTHTNTRSSAREYVEPSCGVDNLGFRTRLTVRQPRV
jgi:hypothetical protein